MLIILSLDLLVFCFTDEDINNPEVFAKLDNSQMASVIAKELKYFTKQGGNIVFDGIYV